MGISYFFICGGVCPARKFGAMVYNMTNVAFFKMGWGKPKFLFSIPMDVVPLRYDVVLYNGYTCRVMSRILVPNPTETGTVTGVQLYCEISADKNVT